MQNCLNNKMSYATKRTFMLRLFLVWILYMIAMTPKCNTLTCLCDTEKVVCVFLWRVTCLNVLKAPLASPCEIYYRKIQKHPMVSSPQWPSVWYVTVEENISGTWSHANGASCNWFDRQLVIWSGYSIIWYNSLMLKWNAWVGSMETLLLCSLVTELRPVLEWLSGFLQLYHLGQENQAKRGKQI